MASSEQSFADRLGRARTLQSKIAGFTPTFTPTDPDLGAAAFDAYIGSVADLNSDVGAAASDAATLAGNRLEAAKELRDTALRLKDHVVANKLWKSFIKGVSKAADAVRGYRLPRKAAAVVPGAPPTPEKPAGQGSRSQQGYADVENLFDRLVTEVKKVTGYTAGAGSGLTIAEITVQHEAFSQLNKQVSKAESDLGTLQTRREEAYTGEDGLKAKMKAIKKAVRAQYKPGSGQYADVKGILV
jgi:flagellin-like hook-associated protein FlgL